MMKRNSILETLAAVIGVLLFLEGVTTIGDHQSQGLLMLIGAVAIGFLIAYAKTNKNPFTPEQAKLIQELIYKELVRNRASVKQIIDDGAKRGDTISTDEILKSIDDLKASYHGPNSEQYFAELDRFSNEFRQKYGTNIPVDMAYKILKEYEDEHGRLGD
jgi:hypothetical protein